MLHSPRITLAAAITASTICLYPVQRHTFLVFWNQSRTSSRVGSGFCSNRAYAETMKPGTQKPHCTAPQFIHATCNGCRCCGVPIPSMVVILEYSSTWLIFLVQERITCPFRMMEHEPQTPVPHPTLTPVRPIRRRTSDSLSFSGSHINIRSTPLMFNIIFLNFMLLYPPFFIQVEPPDSTEINRPPMLPTILPHRT